MKNFNTILLAIRLSTVHMIFWRFFAQGVPAENEVGFHC